MKIKYYIKLHSGVEETGVTEESSVEEFKDNFKMFYGDFILNLDAEEITEEIVEPNDNTLIKTGKRLMDEQARLSALWDTSRDSKEYWKEMYIANNTKMKQVMSALKTSL